MQRKWNFVENLFGYRSLRESKESDNEAKLQRKGTTPGLNSFAYYAQVSMYENLCEWEKCIQLLKEFIAFIDLYKLQVSIYMLFLWYYQACTAVIAIFLDILCCLRVWGVWNKPNTLVGPWYPFFFLTKRSRMHHKGSIVVLQECNKILADNTYSGMKSYSFQSKNCSHIRVKLSNPDQK